MELIYTPNAKSRKISQYYIDGLVQDCSIYSAIATKILAPKLKIMMTSSNGNLFRVIGHLCGEITGLRWIPISKASDAELWCFLWSVPDKRLSKQSWGWWFETQSGLLWRHSNVMSINYSVRDVSVSLSMHSLHCALVYGYLLQSLPNTIYHHASLTFCNNVQ